MLRPPHALLLSTLALACTVDSKSGSPSASTRAPATTQPPPVSVPCTLDVTEPGPMRRAGRVRVNLAGGDVTIDTEVPALCGPLFNRDVAALGIKAGDGLLFEACVPEGYLQLTSRERAAGVQRLHHGEVQAGTMDVSFNRVGGTTYSSRGLATDRVTLSDDFWKAEAELVLRDVDEAGELRARIGFDCSAAPPEPAAPAADAPPASGDESHEP